MGSKTEVAVLRRAELRRTKLLLVWRVLNWPEKCEIQTIRRAHIVVRRIMRAWPERSILCRRRAQHELIFNLWKLNISHVNVILDLRVRKDF